MFANPTLLTALALLSPLALTFFGVAGDVA